jgi:hypothetical protein
MGKSVGIGIVLWVFSCLFPSIRKHADVTYGGGVRYCLSAC